MYQVPKIDDYNLALRNRLLEIMIDGNEVPVYFANPEEEFSPETIPCIVLFMQGMNYDPFRVNNDIIQEDVYDGENKLVAKTQIQYPTPWNFIYTVRYYYEYKIDGNELLQSISEKLPKYTFLEVLGTDYDLELLSVNIPEQKGFKVTEERKFFGQFTFKLEAELENRDTVKTEVKVSTKPVSVISINRL